MPEIRKNAKTIIFKLLQALMLCGLYGCFWEGTDDSLDYLPMDDSEYPYAGHPRIVIETHNFEQIRYRGEEMQARLQIYGKRAPESDVIDLTLHGRGNSSFKMPKYGIKLEFDKKISLFGMPANKDWALIANYGDKTHLRNFIAYKLSEWLGAKYTPKVHFVELYLNRKYMGLYLLSETVKVGKERVNISDSTFLIEKEDIKKVDDPYVVTERENYFHIKYPKNIGEESKQLVLDHLNAFEKYLYEWEGRNSLTLDDWIDMDDFILFYWIQEFSKNEDGLFARSSFFTWEKGGTFHFGPVWDFDISFGNEPRDDVKMPEEWWIRRGRWFSTIFNGYGFNTKELAKEYWLENRNTFKALIDSVPLYKKEIDQVIKNEYKRWPILSNTENWALKDPYDSYDEAVEAMITWMRARYAWIEENL